MDNDAVLTEGYRDYIVMTRYQRQCDLGPREELPAPEPEKTPAPEPEKKKWTRLICAVLAAAAYIAGIAGLIFGLTMTFVLCAVGTDGDAEVTRLALVSLGIAGAGAVALVIGRVCYVVSRSLK